MQIAFLQVDTGGGRRELEEIQLSTEPCVYLAGRARDMNRASLVAMKLDERVWVGLVLVVVVLTTD